LIARAIYPAQRTRAAPFIGINCAAIPETLLESELFGTSAARSRRGHAAHRRFEQAARGTFFLDEIGDMTPATQVKLLRVLQTRTIQRLAQRNDSCGCARRRRDAS